MGLHAVLSLAAHYTFWVIHPFEYYAVGTTVYTAGIVVCLCYCKHILHIQYKSKPLATDFSLA